MTTPLVPAGTKIVNPFNHQTFIFTKPYEKEAVAEFDVLLGRGGSSSVKDTAHIHPKSDEFFTVQSGLLKVFIDGEEHLVRPGETIKVPRGTPHYFRNGHEDETLMTLRFTPGMKFLRFFLNFATATAERPEWFDENGEGPLLLAALAFHAFPDQVYVAGVPIWLQKMLFAVLSPIARLAGYSLPFEPQNAPKWHDAPSIA